MADQTNDPDYQEYQQYLEYLKHTSQPQAPSDFQAGLENFANKATFGNLPRMQAAVGSALGLGDADQLRKENVDRLAQENQNSPNASLVGKALGIGATMLPVGVAAAPASALGRIGAGALQGAATGALEEPDATKSGLQLADRAKNAAYGAGLGGAITGATEGIGALLRKGGDAAMQIAVGRKKYTPGVGTTLADEGVWGTKGMMADQVANKLDERGQEISDLAKQIPTGSINSPSIASDIQATASKPLTVPGANPSSSDVDKLNAINSFTDDIASRGAESGEQALQRRIAAGQRSYRGKEDPLQSLIGNLSKQEQQQYSSALKNAHQAATGSDAMSVADNAYGALKRAQKGLDEDPSLPRSLFQALSIPATHIPGGSIGASTAGQVATKAGQNVSNPQARQGLLDLLLQSK